MMPATFPYLLYADDDSDDRAFFEQVLRSGFPSIALTILADGLELLTFLRALPDGRALPGLIVLDINMPRLSGYEVLDILKADARFRAIPVVLFSTSTRAGEAAAAAGAGAARFYSKPSSLAQFQTICAELAELCRSGQVVP